MELQLVVIDHCAEWEHCLLSYEQTLKQLYPRVLLQLTFLCVDLLCPSAPSCMAEALQAAQLCTMFYGFSELFERDPKATGEQCETQQ